MKKTIFFLLYSLALILLVVVAMTFIQKSAPAKDTQNKDTLPSLPPIPPTDIETVVFPESLQKESIAIGKSGAQKIKISWDTNIFNVFAVVLIDAELFRNGDKKATQFLTSSTTGFLTTPDKITRQQVAGYISPGYVLGESVPHFQSIPSAPTEVLLSVGRKYILQVSAFEKKDEFPEQVSVINKYFTFTSSCLPPDCK